MSAYSYMDNRPTARVSPNGMTSGPPPATEGCGPGITLCSLRKLASEACPPPMIPYGGLPGFKQYWLDGYYSACEGQRAMLRATLGLERSKECGTLGQIGKWTVIVGGVAIFAGTTGGLIWALETKAFFEVVHWLPVAGGGVLLGGLLTYGGLRQC